jgi:hypothetical protein
MDVLGNSIELSVKSSGWRGLFVDHVSREVKPNMHHRYERERERESEKESEKKEGNTFFRGQWWHFGVA